MVPREGHPHVFPAPFSTCIAALSSRLKIQTFSMKTVLFLRHAKSDWDADFEHDHERPLNKRGRRAADQVGRYLAEVEQVPDLLLSSTAVRARTTLERAREAGAWPARPHQLTRDLYGASPAAVLALIHAQPETAASLLLVGHEPTWSETVGRLVGDADVRMPTAALARVDCYVDRWQDVRMGAGQLIFLLPPKLLP